MNPVIVMCVWGRLELVEINLRLLESQYCKVVCVVSTKQDHEFINRLKLPYVHLFEHANIPLGQKWQFGAECARKLGADPVIILGSDDYLSENFVRIGSKMSKYNDFIYFDRWMIYEPGTQKGYSLQYQTTFPLGSGRVFSKSFLDRYKWELFDTGRNYHLDEFIWDQTGFNDMILRNADGMNLLSIKGKWEAMNPLDKLLNTERIKWDYENNLDKHFNFNRPIKEIFSCVA